MCFTPGSHHKWVINRNTSNNLYSFFLRIDNDRRIKNNIFFFGKLWCCISLHCQDNGNTFFRYQILHLTFNADDLTEILLKKTQCLNSSWIWLSVDNTKAIGDQWKYLLLQVTDYTMWYSDHVIFHIPYHMTQRNTHVFSKW